jgi:pyruvate carboxylase
MDVLNPGKKLSFPKSVVEMMQGYLGTPPGGWPKVLQKIILDSADAKPLKGRPGATLQKADFAASKMELAKKIGREPSATDLLSYLLYPQVYTDYQKHVQQYSNTSVLPTSAFFYGLHRGDEISVSEPHDDGTRTVFYELNGQPREVKIADRSLEAATHRHPKADADDPNHVAAPMPGKVSTVAVKKGETVKNGQKLLSIEAMKMETAVYSPRDATVAEILVKPGSTIQARDLLVVLE